MKRINGAFLGVLVGFTLLFTAFPGISAQKAQLPYPDVRRVSEKKCVKMLGNVPPPILIDVRLPEQFKESLQKLPGAVHENPHDVKSWAHKYKKDANIVLY